MFASLLATSLILTELASAETYFVAPDGDNANSCLAELDPCRTVMGAVNKKQVGVDAICVAPGTYDELLDIVYFRRLFISGDCSQAGTVLRSGCSDRNRVVLTVTRPNRAIASIQDGAVVTLNCLTLASDSDNVSGISTRQFAVGDFRDVRFAVTGTMAASSEQSKVNCVGTVEIMRSGIVYATAVGVSTASITCPTYIAPDVAFVAFVTAGWKSLIDASGFVLRGSNIVGQKYILQDATLLQPDGGLPGTIEGGCHDGCVVKTIK